MKRIIAIDPSSSDAGIAFFENKELKSCFTLSAKGKSILERMQIIIGFFKEHLKKELPCYAAIETPYFGMNRAVSVKMGQISGMFIATCLLYGIPFDSIFQIHPLTAKKAAGLTGSKKRKEGKQVVLDKMRQMFPKLSIDNDNEADAIAVGLAAIQKIGEQDDRQ